MNPTNQNLSEEAQEAFLNAHGIAVKCIPSKGKLSRKFTANGCNPQISIRGSGKKSTTDYGSTIDMALGPTLELTDFEHACINFICKFTNGSGGQQSMQSINVDKLLSSVIAYLKNHPNTPHRFVFLLDGDETGDMGRSIEEIKDKAKPYPQILFVGSSDELVANKHILEEALAK
jgi:hypothetical protein